MSHAFNRFKNLTFMKTIGPMLKFVEGRFMIANIYVLRFNRTENLLLVEA
jgi:hypothetical protein